jgi:mannan endo-1,4-beta-mannosidase
LSNLDLEFVFHEGDGQQVQLWYKDQNWRNVYSFPYPITSGQPSRYNSFTDGRNVDEFDDFTHIYAIGAKVWGGVDGVQIISARLIPRLAPSPGTEVPASGISVTPTAQPLASLRTENELQPVVEGEFVTRQSSQLMLAGHPFRFVGTNAYFLVPEMAYGNQTSVIETLDSAVMSGMSVVRIWAFNDNDPEGDSAAIQVEPGVYREESLVALDQVVAEAKKRNIRLILTLTNNWPDYGGVDRYVQWYQAQCNCAANHSDFYTNETIKGWYKNYVGMLLNHTNTVTGKKYKEEEVFLALELGNELRNPGGRSDDLLAWQEEMAAYIKSLDPNHLVADGGEGFDDAPDLYPDLSNLYAVRGDEGASYHRLLDQPSIDMVSYHLYPNKWGLNDERDVEIWIRVHEELAQQASKVAYLGEFGVMGADALRAVTFNRWLTTALVDNQSAGALVWGLVYQNRPDYDGFSVYCPAQVETCAVLHNHAARTWERH